MSIRAVIFDLYNTLLKVDPPPHDAAQRWENLWHEYLGSPVVFGLGEFDAAAARIIVREQAAARAAGIDYPEIDWPAVAREVLPGLKALPATAQDKFLHRHAQLQHITSLMPGAASVLQRLSGSDVLLGLASNCQLYSLREFDKALSSAGLDRAIFQSDLCFLSFEKKFSKPSPRVFQWLTAALRERQIAPDQTLMVGDRLDKDIEPARAAGWQALQLDPLHPAESWRQLDRAVLNG